MKYLDLPKHPIYLHKLRWINSGTLPAFEYTALIENQMQMGFHGTYLKADANEKIKAETCSYLGIETQN